LVIDPRPPALPARCRSRRKKHARRLDDGDHRREARDKAADKVAGRAEIDRPPLLQPTATAVRTSPILATIAPIMKAYAIGRPRLPIG
jgi:hypothetical protein